MPQRSYQEFPLECSKEFAIAIICSYSQINEQNMNIKKLKYYINRPEYIFRPFQIYQRIFNQDYSSTSKLKDVVLPWGLNIKVSTFTNDTLGKALLKFGIYDLSLTEVIWRLIEPNETAIDIGANVCYVTSLMSVKVGKAEKVWCFEPNP